ncbi:MAG: hypothetical protein J5545_13055, partial [Bacteroidaceae bacterium]|nr:hypothetical protein [Bacteroidaceae bacterium]
MLIGEKVDGDLVCRRKSRQSLRIGQEKRGKKQEKVTERLKIVASRAAVTVKNFALSSGAGQGEGF